MRPIYFIMLRKILLSTFVTCKCYGKLFTPSWSQNTHGTIVNIRRGCHFSSSSLPPYLCRSSFAPSLGDVSGLDLTTCLKLLSVVGFFQGLWDLCLGKIRGTIFIISLAPKSVHNKFWVSPFYACSMTYLGDDQYRVNKPTMKSSMRGIFQRWAQK